MKVNFSLGTNNEASQSSTGAEGQHVHHHIHALRDLCPLAISPPPSHPTTTDAKITCRRKQGASFSIAVTIGKRLSGPQTHDSCFALELCPWSQWRCNAAQLLPCFPIRCCCGGGDRFTHPLHPPGGLPLRCVILTSKFPA